MHEAYGPRDPELQYVHGCGILEHRKGLRHQTASWLAIQAIEITILSHRKFIVTEEGRGVTRFRPGPYPIQLVHKWRHPNPRGPISFLCRWHVYVCVCICAYMQQTAMRAMFSDSCNAASPAIESRCEHWNIKIHADKTQAIYFSRRRRPVKAHLTLEGRNIPLVIL
jgi:hypothetical protein